MGQTCVFSGVDVGCIQLEERIIDFVYANALLQHYWIIHRRHWLHQGNWQMPPTARTKWIQYFCGILYMSSSRSAASLRSKYSHKYILVVVITSPATLLLGLLIRPPASSPCSSCSLIMDAIRETSLHKWLICATSNCGEIARLHMNARGG